MNTHIKKLLSNEASINSPYFWVHFFLSEFSFTDTDSSEGSKRRVGTKLYSSLPLTFTYKHSDIYLQLSMWDDHQIFLFAPRVTTRLLLDEFYHLTELQFWLIDDAILVSVSFFHDLNLDICYSSFSLETRGFELT